MKNITKKIIVVAVITAIVLINMSATAFVRTGAVSEWKAKRYLKEKYPDMTISVMAVRPYDEHYVSYWVYDSEEDFHNLRGGGTILAEDWALESMDY